MVDIERVYWTNNYCIQKNQLSFTFKSNVSWRLNEPPAYFYHGFLLTTAKTVIYIFNQQTNICLILKWKISFLKIRKNQAHTHTNDTPSTDLVKFDSKAFFSLNLI